MKKAIVIGSTGLVGSTLANHLSQKDGWEVLGISRSGPDKEVHYKHIAADLLDGRSLRNALQANPGITHVFSAARVRGSDFDDIEKKNVDMLRNVIDSLEESSSSLEHVHLVHGTKWYGGHLAPTDVPAREDDARQMPPNPYYAQYDYIRERQKDRSWYWSSVRPGLIIGANYGYPHNITCLVGIYASICRELHMPLRFPGNEVSYRLVQTGIDVRILCRAIEWLSTNPKARNNAYNIANGDVFQWANMWPKIAKFYGMEPGHVQPLMLQNQMADKGPIWNKMVDKYKLQSFAMKDLVSWDYGDYHFNKRRSDLPSLIKIWQTGFKEHIDTEELFIEMLQEYRNSNVIP